MRAEVWRKIAGILRMSCSITLMCSPYIHFTCSREWLCSLTQVPGSACTGDLRQAARLVGIQPLRKSQVLSKELAGYDIGYGRKQFSDARLRTLRRMISTLHGACCRTDCTC